MSNDADGHMIPPFIQYATGVDLSPGRTDRDIVELVPDMFWEAT